MGLFIDPNNNSLAKQTRGSLATQVKLSKDKRLGDFFNFMLDSSSLFLKEY
jgi:hypothetical protein